MQTNIPSNLQGNIEQVSPGPDKCYIGAMTFNLSNKGNHLWNDMITGNFEQVSPTQTELWCKLNHQIEPKSNKGKCEAKRHDANNATNQGAIGRTERDLLKGYDLRTNYAKNTTNVTFCDLEQVTSSIQTKNVYKKNNANITCQLLHHSRW